MLSYPQTGVTINTAAAALASSNLIERVPTGERRGPLRNSCQGNTASYSHGNTQSGTVINQLDWIDWMDGQTILSLICSVWGTRASTYLLVGVVNYTVHS